MKRTFSPDFLWGAATAAYQIEGAWNIDGKGRSIWDDFVRRRGAILTGERGDEACDHYHRYREDVALMESMGLGAYRFSVSWTRIIPDGVGAVNREGLDFYRRLIDRLLEAGITPFATLFHWDLPAAIQRRGGFVSPDIVDHFRRYAEVVVRELGDRVRHWITLNEPFSFSVMGYLTGEHAPGRRNPWLALRAARHAMLAHGAAYRAIKEIASESEVGISQLLIPTLPMRPRDAHAARRAGELINGLFVDPLLLGRYPRTAQRLLRFFVGPGSVEAESIAGTLDFLGLNHYFPLRIRRAPIPGFGFLPVEAREDPQRLTAMGWPIAPAAFGDLLGTVRREYGNPPVYVTESGAAFHDTIDRDGRIDDGRRIEYLASYIAQVHRALESGSDIRGYFAWSLMDNFEWAHGTSKRFGLVYVDYPTQKRTVKASGRWYSRLCKGRVLEEPLLSGNNA